MDQIEGEGTTAKRSSGRAGWPIDPHRVKRALWRGRVSLITAGVAGLLVGYVIAKFFMTSGYETTAVLKYEGDLDLPGLPSTRDTIGPAADALTNQAVLRKIREESGFQGSLTALAASMSYRVDYLTNTMHIGVAAQTAEGAAERARLVTDVFMRYHKERQSRRIEDEITRVQKRIEAAEGEAEAARRVYNQFREQHGIADLSTEQESMVESAAKLQADSELAESEVRALEAQVKSLETQLQSTPKTNLLLGSSPERDAYNRLRQELVDARSTLSDDHPRVQSLQQQVNQLRQQLGRGGGSSGDGLVAMNTTYQAIDEQLREAKASLSALRERQKGLSAMAARAKERISTYSEIEGEAAGLLASVTVNESLSGSLRRTEAALEDALRDPPSGFVVLDPGAVPEYPVGNKMKLVVFGAIPMLTFGLALLVVLRRELRGLRIETPAEVAFWGRGPVLGATSWPDDPRGLDELVAGLDDFAPEAQGTLLIVGASTSEAPLAAELADRMNEDWFAADDAEISATASDPSVERRAPLKTPPPGPYPISRVPAGSTALARRPSAPPVEPVRLVQRPFHLRLEAWDGPQEGQALRRAARLADRVIVLVRSGATSIPRLNAIGNRLGRGEGVGYIVVGLAHEHRTLPDRAGDVASFWKI